MTEIDNTVEESAIILRLISLVVDFASEVLRDVLLQHVKPSTLEAVLQANLNTITNLRGKFLFPEQYIEEIQIFVMNITFISSSKVKKKKYCMSSEITLLNFLYFSLVKITLEICMLFHQYFPYSSFFVYMYNKLR